MMINKISTQVERVALKAQLSQKQRLYAQMTKDNINGPVMQKLSEEIGQINLQLYGYGTKQQRA